MGLHKFEQETVEDVVERLVKQLYQWSGALSFQEIKSNKLLLSAVEELEDTLVRAGARLQQVEGDYPWT